MRNTSMMTCLAGGLSLLGLSALLPQQAFAACVVTSGSTAVCSGTNTASQTVTIDNANVTTTPGFSVDTTASSGDALTISGAGAMSYNDANASTLQSASTALSVTATGNSGVTPGSVTINTGGAITGADGNGIFARNSGGGATSITASGAVTAFGNVGFGIGAIFVQNDASATDLTVNAASARGDLYGIWVDNAGTGATSITATGTVSGSASGIYAHNAASATDLTIAAAIVVGSDFAIDAQNSGSGKTSITTGDVFATTSGMIVSNGATATDLTVRTGAVTGGRNGTGISVFNSGRGATSVTATGLVEVGTAGTGIHAVNGGSSTSLTINTAAVNGDDYGIYADNNGHGATQVTATGAVTAAGVANPGATGIFVRNFASATDLTVNAVDVSGGTTGIYAENGGTGVTAITATGEVAGQTSGIVVRNGTTATDLIVNAAAVTGGRAGRFGMGISAINNGVGATSVTATGLVAGGNGGEGIHAANGASATSLTVNAADVSGDTYGIYADNAGSGATSVTATGAVTVAGVSGPGATGIFARNAASATDLNINAAAVGSTSYGIYAENRGRGVTSVTATGDVVAPLIYGIVAVNGQATFDASGNITGVAASNGTDLTVKAAAVTGAAAGIYAWNVGSGATSVTAAGSVSGNSQVGSGRGIFAQNGATATSLTVQAAAVSGDGYGLYVHNAGTGATSITTTGAVIGSGDAGTGTGIFAQNEATATSLTVNAAAVRGDIWGIQTYNAGTGATSITATGAVSGIIGIDARNATSATDLTINATVASGRDEGIIAENAGTGATRVTVTGGVFALSSGILAFNGARATDLTVNAATVTADRNGLGISASNGGTGATSVTATGLVSSGTNGEGIHVSNASSATSLTVNAADVSSDAYGIYADNAGTGATSVTATGAVIAAGIAVPDAVGIFARNSASATSLRVDAADVSGGSYGIYAENRGRESTSITVRGIVEGGIAGIDVVSTQIALIRITGANAEVRNASRDPSAAAIVTSGGSATLFNEARLTGTVQLGGAGNLVLNSGVWTTAGGVNAFGTGGNTLINTGTIAAAVSGAQAETARFNGLTNFSNSGLLTLQDGGAGDTVRFSGNLISTAGSVQAIDINKAGQSDRVLVDGVASIGGTTLNVANQGGYTVGTRYTVLTATGALIGTYGNITGSGAFIGLVDTYDAHNAYLDVTQARTFRAAALTRNQVAISSSLDGLETTDTSNAVYKAVVNSATDGQARVSFDSLSGAVHASGQTALIENSHFVSDSAIDRIRQSFDAVGAPSMPVMSFAADAPASSALDAMAYAMPAKARPMRAPESGSTLAIWGQGFGSWGHTGGDGNAAAVNRSTGGIITGIDGVVAETWRLGLMAGYSRSNFSVSDVASSGQSDNYHVGIYGGTQWGPLGFRAGAVYTWHDISTARSVNMPGLSDRLRADYHAGTTQVFGEFGYRLDWYRMALEPFVNLAHVHMHTDGFAESGGLAALTSIGTSTDTTFTTLGLRGATSFMLGTVATTARGTLGWRHAFGDVTPLSTFAFAGSSAFSVAGVPLAKDAAVVEAGLDFAVTRAATVGVTYGGQFGDNARDQNVRGTLAIKF